MNNGLYIILCSGEHEKIQMAAMMASVGAVSERPVEVFVSMNAMLAFVDGLSLEERFKGGVYSDLLHKTKAPEPLTLFRQGKEFGSLKLWACSMALDVQGWEMSQLEGELFDGPMGLTKFLSDAENGQLVSL